MDDLSVGSDVQRLEMSSSMILERQRVSCLFFFLNLHICVLYQSQGKKAMANPLVNYKSADLCFSLWSPSSPASPLRDNS